MGPQVCTVFPTIQIAFAPERPPLHHAGGSHRQFSYLSSIFFKLLQKLPSAVPQSPHRQVVDFPSRVP